MTAVAMATAVEGDSIVAVPATMSTIREWCYVVASLAVLALFLFKSFRLLTSRKSRPEVRYEFAISLRSAAVYVAMAMPPLVFTCTVKEDGRDIIYSWSKCPKSPYTLIATNFMHIYHWVPFWYSCLITPLLGFFIEGVRQALKGTLIAMVAMDLMNHLMPGGAGIRYQELNLARKAWLPGGYNKTAAVMCFVVFAYATFLLKGSTGTKKYVLCLFSGYIVPFMNPETSTGFRAVLLDSDYKPNWDGPILCDAWVIILAILCAALPLGLVPCSRRSWERHTCIGKASSGLVDLARDTHGCMEWLVTNFSESTLHFDVDSPFLVIRQLGTRRTSIETLLTNAKLECYVGASRHHLQILWRFSNLLRHLRHILRVELELVRSLSCAFTDPCPPEVTEHLQDFLVACRDGLSVLAESVVRYKECSTGLHESVCRVVFEATSRADRALVSALQQCSIKKKNDGKAVIIEMAFIERLRSWPALIDHMLRESQDNPIVQDSSTVKPEVRGASGSTADGGSRQRHLNAMRNTIAWVVGLYWSIYKRGFNSGCVVGISMIFSATPGSSFDTNINRMLGVAMGLAMGNIPALLALQGVPPDSRSLQFLQCIVSYSVIMFLMWSMSMYGYVATGSKYSYACLIWVGISSSQMMQNLQTFHGTRGLFMDVIDNILACVIIFLVDTAFAYLFGMSTSEQMNAAVCECLDDVSMIMDNFTSCQVAGFDIACLGDHIKNARFWEAELRKEGLVWNTLWETSINSESVPALLNHCDSVYLAMYAMQMSAERCSSKEFAYDIIRKVLTGELPKRCRLHQRATRALLSGEDLDAEVIGSLLGGDVPLSPQAKGDSDEAWPKRDTSLDLLDKIYEDSLCVLDSLSSNPCGAETSDSKVSEAAAVALRVSATSLRVALRRIGLLLSAQLALTSKDWRAVGRPSRAVPVSRMTTHKLVDGLLQH